MNDTPPSPIHDVDDRDLLASAFQILGRVEDQLRFADGKAGFLATIHAFFISPLVYNVAEVRAAYRNWDPASLTALIGFGGAYALLFLITMGLVGLTVLPRNRVKARAPSRLFFGRIAREHGHAPAQFVAILASMSQRAWLDEIGLYIVDVSALAAIKHRCVRWATIASVPTLLLWFATVAILFCAHL